MLRPDHDLCGQVLLGLLTLLRCMLPASFHISKLLPQALDFGHLMLALLSVFEACLQLVFELGELILCACMLLAMLHCCFERGVKLGLHAVAMVLACSQGASQLSNLVSMLAPLSCPFLSVSQACRL